MATISVVLFGISSLFLHKLREDLSNVQQFRMRLQFWERSRRASKMNSQALESEIARGYHFPLEAIIFSPRLSFSPRGYHFPLEAIIFLSRLSFSLRGYHFLLASLVLQVSHGGIYFNRYFVSHRNWKPSSLTTVPLCLPFCLPFSSCKHSATQCWLKVPPRE